MIGWLERQNIEALPSLAAVASHPELGRWSSWFLRRSAGVLSQTRDRHKSSQATNTSPVPPSANPCHPGSPLASLQNARFVPCSMIARWLPTGDDIKFFYQTLCIIFSNNFIAIPANSPPLTSSLHRSLKTLCQILEINPTGPRDRSRLDHLPKQAKSYCPRCRLLSDHGGVSPALA